MQPEEQNSNWQKSDNDGSGFDQPPQQPEMYAPAPDNSDSFPEDKSVNNSPTENIQESQDELVRWTASEYIHESKGGLWFIVFAIVIVVLIAVDLLFIKSYTFSGLVVVMAAALVIYSRRPPQIIEYTLSGKQGLYVGDRLHNFGEFKAFGLIRDGEHHSIMLIPIKRFNMGVSVYFPEEVGEKIVDILGARLPMENLKLDAVDVIVRKLHL